MKSSPSRSSPGGGCRLRGFGVPPETVARFAEAHGLAVADETDPGDRVVALLGAVDDALLGQVLSPPVVACFEVAGEPEGFAERLLPAVADGELFVSLTTATAYQTYVACHFCRALTGRAGLSGACAGDMEVAVHEAVINGIIHGNLEISAYFPRSHREIDAYGRTVSSRLADPRFGGRRIEVSARLREGAAEVSVRDSGAGYADPFGDPGQPLHRGLRLIRALAQSVDVSGGGRRITMGFAR